MFTIPPTIADFAARAGNMTNDEIYEYLESNLELRDSIMDMFASVSSTEPVREALNALGDATNVQSLMDY